VHEGEVVNIVAAGGDCARFHALVFGRIEIGERVTAAVVEEGAVIAVGVKQFEHGADVAVGMVPRFAFDEQRRAVRFECVPRALEDGQLVAFDVDLKEVGGAVLRGEERV